MKHEMTPLDVARFWSRVSGGTDFQCWNWRGRSNQAGYGRIKRDVAHRIAYQLVNGDIPNGLVIRHRCDNPRCCNPKHLEPGTALDNSADAVSRGRLAMGARNGRSKITADEVAYVRSNPDGLTQKALATRFGMAESSISYIRSGRSWKMVDATGIEPVTPTV